MKFDEYLRNTNSFSARKRSLNEDEYGSFKASFVVNMETEEYDDGDVAAFISDDDGNFQISQVFKDMKSAKASLDKAKKLFQRMPWSAVEQLKLNGYENA